MCLAVAGKSFFKRRKVPIPVNLERKDWSAQIQKALSATYLNKNGGSCISIRCTAADLHAAHASGCHGSSVASAFPVVNACCSPARQHKHNRLAVGAGMHTHLSTFWYYCIETAADRELTCSVPAELPRAPCLGKSV